jgi:trk system potassium uptake protein TrkH
LESIRKIVANLGFFLQVEGLLLILPIVIGLQYDELQAVASLIATCFFSFGVGFVFNSFAERKEMDERTSLWLFVAAFTIIPLVLMIPYVWNNVFNSGNLFDLFSDAYFETVSGFTTTGFTFISNPETLPLALFFYRSLVEFIGGIGFVYILVAFLYRQEDLDDFCDAFGIEQICGNLKKAFAAIILIYTLFVVLFTVIFYFTYSPNLIISSCAAIDVLTGGYQPNITGGIGLFQISVLMLMLLGSLNFRFHFNLFRLKLRDLLTPEIKLYLEVIAISTVIISILAWINPFDSLFHVVSMTSSTGIEYLNIATTPLPAKIFFILIGLAGGCTFSMAGGIKMQRIRALINVIRKNSDKPTREELKSIMVFIASFVAILVILSFAFSTLGISMLDSIFEVGSALTTNGVSMGATTIALPIGYKWLLIFAMIVGRIEIVNIYRAIRGNSR